MTTINSIISQSFSWIWSEFLALLGFLTDGWAGIVILVYIIVVSVVARKVIKVQSWRKVFDAIGTVVVLLLVLVIGIHSYRYISNLPKSSSPSSGSGSSNSSGGSGSESTAPSTQSAPSQSAPAQTQKQLYYTTSCSNCYAEGCNRNGYSYGGYSEANYIYYKSLCDQCSCADKKSQSFWK